MFDTIVHRWFRVPYALHVRQLRSVKKSPATILFIHGIGSSGDEWAEIIEKLPDTISFLSIDLLGFGKSPRPSWATYNAKTQARSVIASLVKHTPKQKLIIVGHSLGSIVAVEVAKRYPLIVNSLILCSPPFYRPQTKRGLPTADQALRKLFSRVENRQEYFLKLTSLAHKHKLINKAFHVTPDNFDSFVATLSTAIISQTAYDDVKHIQKPMTIIYGSLDPFVIDKNMKKIARANHQIRLVRVLVGHEVMGRYVPAIVREVKRQVG